VSAGEGVGGGGREGGQVFQGLWKRVRVGGWGGGAGAGGMQCIQHLVLDTGALVDMYISRGLDSIEKNGAEQRKIRPTSVSAGLHCVSRENMCYVMCAM
jgi:hypothetical protein